MKVSDIEVTLIDRMGSDLSVVNAARVSFAKESDWADSHEWLSDGDKGLELKESDKKLINYLARHKHFSPFNHAFMTVRVKAPIFVARQLVKHKFMPWNEVSRRYVDDEPEFYLPELRKRAENVKQGSSDEKVEIQDLGNGMAWNPAKVLLFQTESALEAYNELLEGGVCPEQARMVLPQNTMTEWIWSGSLGAFADMLKLRLDPHTQAETRIVAEKIHDLVIWNFPVSIEALLENK